MYKVIALIFSLYLVVGSELSWAWIAQAPSYENTFQGRTAAKLTRGKTTKATAATSTTEHITETTTSLPSEASLKQKCEPGNNTYVRSDLIEMIASRTSHVIENITAGYKELAVSVHDRHANNLQEFLGRFKDRPEHLKDILKELLKSRTNIKSVIDKVNKIIENYPQLEDFYNKTIANATELLKNVNDIKYICEKYCEAQHKQVLKQSVDTSDEEFYCGKDKDVNEKIRSSTEEFIRNIVDEYKQKITVKDEQCGKKVETLKEQLKGVALEEFGSTMYDILNLMDIYHHFNEDLRPDAIKSDMTGIQCNLHDIQGKIFNLMNRASKLDDTCKQCIQNTFKQSLFASSMHYSKAESKDLLTNIHEVMPDIPDSNCLLEKLLIEKQNADREGVESEYLEIFKDLDEKLDIENANKYIVDLKSIDIQVKELTTKENDEYKQLQVELPSAMIDNVKSLKSKTDELALQLQVVEKDLQEHENTYNNNRKI